MIRISALLACHNRREKTLTCLRNLYGQSGLGERFSLSSFLVDDGSTDGTAEAVTRDFPNVNVFRGDGTLFWNRSMHLAMREASREEADFYLWINDDTQLRDDAFSILLDTYSAVSEGGSQRVLVVGAICDPDSGQGTYGGVVRTSRWHPFHYRLVSPTGTPARCDTMNGNCVLIPRDVARLVGNLEPAFRHAIGDTDYGLRARARGCSLWLTPGFVGTCRRNPAAEGAWHKSLPLRERWRKVCSPKGLPPREFLVFARRHGGLLWPAFWALPYLRLIFRPSA